MKNLVFLILFFSIQTFSKEPKTETVFTLNFPPIIKLKQKLTLGEIKLNDCDCDNGSKKLELPDIREKAGQGKALTDFYRHLKSKDRKFTGISIEVISPIFNKGQAPKKRTKLPPINLISILDDLKKDPKEYSDEQIEKIILSKNIKSNSESNEDYATRVHSAITALKASDFGRSNPKEALKYIEAKMKGKSFKHKIHFLSQMLDRLYGNYDKNMPSGEVEDLSLYQEIYKDNLGKGTPDDRFKNVAGICRHIHQLALRMARRMGLKMAYGLSYPTETGYHLNLIISNPHNPTETIRYNYSNLESVQGADGSSSIPQDMVSPINSGISYHVWDDDDTPLYYIPNQKGVVLEAMSGGDIRLFDPNISADSGIVKGSYQIQGHQFNIFHALNPEIGDTGENIAGASYFKDFKISDNWNAEFGTSLYYSQFSLHKETKDFTDKLIERKIRTGQTTGFYGRLKIGGHWEPVNNLNIDSSLILRGTGFNSTIGFISQFREIESDQTVDTKSKEKEKFLGDGNGSIITNIGFDWSNYSQTKLQIDISGQSKDITAMSIVPSFYLRRATLFHKEDFKTAIGQFTLDTSLNVIPLNEGIVPVIFSPRLTYKDIYKRNEVYVGYTGSLNPNSTPYFIPGARPTFTAGYNHSFLDNQFVIGISASLSPELRFSADQETSVLDATGGNFMDAFKYSEESGISRNIFNRKMKRISKDKTDVPVKTERFNYQIPLDFHLGLFLKANLPTK